MVLLSAPFRTPRTGGILAVVAHETLVFVGDVVYEQPQPFECRHEKADRGRAGLQERTYTSREFKINRRNQKHTNNSTDFQESGQKTFSDTPRR